jgi:hypothetical protein
MILQLSAVLSTAVSISVDRIGAGPADGSADCGHHSTSCARTGADRRRWRLRRLLSWPRSLTGGSTCWPRRPVWRSDSTARTSMRRCTCRSPAVHQGRRRHRAHLALDRRGTAARGRRETDPVHRIATMPEPASGDASSRSQLAAAVDRTLLCLTCTRSSAAVCCCPPLSAAIG